MADFLNYNPYMGTNPSKDKLKEYFEQNPDQSNGYMDRYLAQLEPKSVTPVAPTTESSSYNLPTFLNNVEYFKSLTNLISTNNSTQMQEPIPKNKITDEIKNLSVNDEDKDYLLRLSKRESSYNPYITNKLGYYGLYQFGSAALKDTGFTKDQFKDTINQHNAALSLAHMNENKLKPIINTYQGKEFKGIKITRNGIRAAAHLLGAGTVKEWFNNPLSSNQFKDANGTKIEEYLNMFT